MISIITLAVLIYVADGAFLFGSGTFGGGPGGGPGGFGGGGGCAPLHSFCPTQCPNGYARDGHGCPICHCQDSNPNTMVTAGTYHHISNPCIPTHARCSLNCEQYTKGPGGSCEYCQCDNTHTSTNKPTTKMQTTSATMMPVSTSVAATTDSSAPPTKSENSCEIAAQICDQRCNGEYLSDHKDCTFCVCKSDLG